MRIVKSVFLIIIAVCCVSIAAWADQTVRATDILIKGDIRNPIGLSLKDLERMSTSEVQLNEVLQDGTYKGAFKYKGVPLKLLLSMAGIEKKETDFKKPVDMAVIVKDAAGKAVTLSWGEIFYKDMDNIIIATSAAPIYPHKKAELFKNKEAYKAMMQTLNRTISFPKLVIRSDFYTDRSLEPVTEIDIYDLHPNVPGKKSPDVYSEQFNITGDIKKVLTLKKLPAYTPQKVRVQIVGEGRGYHGRYEYSGIPLKQLIMDTQPDLGLNTVFLISAPDAYRALISYGELFLNPHGNRIIVAEKKDGKPIDSCGKFILILPDDLMADREVKAISKIDVISLDRRK